MKKLFFHYLFIHPVVFFFFSWFHSWSLSWTYSFIQGAINVVMGNAPEIGDALLQSTQVLFPPILHHIRNIRFFRVNRISKNNFFLQDNMLLIGQKDYIHRVNSCWQKTDGWISKYCEEGITEKFWCLDNKIYYECWFSFRIHLIATCLYECARNLGRRFQKTNANWTVFSFNLETCGGGWGWLWYINFFFKIHKGYVQWRNYIWMETGQYSRFLQTHPEHFLFLSA